MDKKILHYLFEQVAYQNPENVAISMEGILISYKQLNAQSNQFAHLLNHYSIEKNDVTAVFLSNSLIKTISLIGIFKSGSIYFPLDEKYNRNHWSELFNRIQPKALLISKEYLSRFIEYAASFDYVIPVIIAIDYTSSELIFSKYSCVNGDYKELPVEIVLSTDNPRIQVAGDDANYIFFTSGSTGKPKAVLGSHQSLSHFIHWESKEFNISSNVRIGMLTSFSFDASLRDVFVPLINGGVLCLPSQEVKENPAMLVEWLRKEKITLLHTIPGMFRLLLHSEANEKKSFPELEYLLLAGEKLYVKDIIAWRNAYGNNTTIVNLYGATESTLIKAFYRVGDLNGKPADVLPAGQPISNTKLLILKDGSRLCGVNEIGSIYIRTPFLSKGYYRDELNTAEKFVQNPLLNEKEIIYKTGDYGRYDENRNVIILGREDAMVKLNGVRIDLNSIEKAVIGHGAVQEVKCILHEPETISSCLVCFYTSTSVTEQELREYCSGYLSQYEIPAIIHRLEKFPVNVNGKTDVPGLQSIVQNILSGKKQKELPANEIEEKLITLWKTVLGIETVGISDNFFELGGSSLKALRLINEVHKKFNVKINIDSIFRHPVVKELAGVISQAANLSQSNPSVTNQIRKTIEI